MIAAASRIAHSGNRLAGKTAVVTGAASGIGRAITEAFVAQDARVLAVNLPGREWPSTLAVRARVRRCEQDVTARDAPSRIVDEVVAGYGGLDIFVNNAGIAIGAAFEETTD